jgi:NAD+ kinase
MSGRTRVRKVGVVSKPNPRRAQPVLERLAAILKAHRVECILDLEAARILGGKVEGVERTSLAGMVDLVIAVGGDGTLLSVARSLGRSRTLVMGINLGGLGFLTEFSSAALEDSLARVLEGSYEVEQRMMLSVEIVRKGAANAKHLVLNDAVINKSALARILDIEVTVGDEPITVYKADGLILSTPTGSTAYCLSAGGPIVHPRMQAIVVTPICPHTLTNRPLVVPPDLVLEARIRDGEGEENVFLLTLDGQVGLPLARTDRVRVRRSAHRLSMVKFPEQDYFQVLRRKLKWGGR